MVLVLLAPAAFGADQPKDSYAETIQVFKSAGESSKFFKDSYGYAVFPTIGKGGVVLVGGAYGDGRVYAQGTQIGTATMSQLSVGPQLGGQAYSEIVFFQDKRSLDEFTSGNFEFGADIGAVAITAGASAGASTGGATASASGGQHDATTAGAYYKGMAVFTVAKGGLMLQAALQGQKFGYKPL
jgi:lipid-binding SYLF domain-containing protein